MIFPDSPVTIFLIGLNALIFFIGLSYESLADKAIMWPYYVKRKKQYYRFISSGFLHANWIHLFFNMFTLYFFGSAIEYYFAKYGLGGKITYIILYLVAIIVSDIPSYLKHRDDPRYRSLGASGAVSAVLFATLVFGPWTQIQLYGIVKISFTIYAVLFVIYCVNMSKQGVDNIDHEAHLWGSIFGLVFTLAIIFMLNSPLFDLVLKEFSHPSLLGRQPIYIQ